jgi:hypothetical protein
MTGKKGLRTMLRRKSFGDGLKESGELQLSGTIGRNLGFWTTAWLGFQTLGSIYGMLSLILGVDDR